MKKLLFILALSIGFAGFTSAPQAQAASNDSTSVSNSQHLEMKGGGAANTNAGIKDVEIRIGSFKL